MPLAGAKASQFPRYAKSSVGLDVTLPQNERRIGLFV